MNVLVMGILNVTPDSFSDGGKYLARAAAVERALQIDEQGAAIIDIGAESTRPGSRPVPAAEQLHRLLPVLKAIRKRSRLAVSIDTQSAAVAEACLAEGARIVNDVSALRADPAMPALLARSRCKVVLMHMQGSPRTMQKNPRYSSPAPTRRGKRAALPAVVAEILRFFRERLRAAAREGIAAERVWLDPGIGFGKATRHNLAILRHLEVFAALGRPLLIGASRKRFLGELTGEPVPERRVAASVAVALAAVQRGASIVRVHDVAETVAALKVFRAVGGA